jgi:hypothetical protein
MTLVQLTDDGSVKQQSETIEFLKQWTEEFVKNRTRSSS